MSAQTKQDIVVCIIGLSILGNIIMLDALLKKNRVIEQLQETAALACDEDTVSVLAENRGWIDFIYAVAYNESRWDKDAVGDKDDVGFLQITPVIVDDANRILGHDAFSMDDRTDIARSIAIFEVIQEKYNPDHDLHLALKIWNPYAKMGYHRAIIRTYDAIRNGEMDIPEEIASQEGDYLAMAQ